MCFSSHCIGLHGRIHTHILPLIPHPQTNPSPLWFPSASSYISSDLSSSLPTFVIPYSSHQFVIAPFTYRILICQITIQAKNHGCTYILCTISFHCHSCVFLSVFVVVIGFPYGYLILLFIGNSRWVFVSTYGCFSRVHTLFLLILGVLL